MLCANCKKFHDATHILQHQFRIPLVTQNWGIEIDLGELGSVKPSYIIPFQLCPLPANSIPINKFTCNNQPPYLKVTTIGQIKFQLKRIFDPDTNLSNSRQLKIINVDFIGKGQFDCCIFSCECFNSATSKFIVAPLYSNNNVCVPNFDELQMIDGDFSFTETENDLNNIYWRNCKTQWLNDLYTELKLV